MKVFETVKDIDILPNQTVLMAKADGEAELLVYNRQGFSDMVEKAYVINKWGRKRTDFPALNEFTEAMKQNPTVESCELMCEAYAMEGDTALMLPQFIHYIKSQDPTLIAKVHLGVWNVLKINGHVVAENYLWRCEQVASWLPNGKLAHILPYLQPKSMMEVQHFWDYYVVNKRYEGLVVWEGREPFKCKPFKELDAVILGVNKKSGYGRGNLFAQKQVTSLKVGLMRPDGKFVEIGDCASGIDHQLRSKLWQVKEKLAIAEDDNVVWIKPRIVIQIGYIDLFKGRNKVYAYEERLNGSAYREVETMPLIRMKSPQLLHFRPDKTVNPQDLRIQQIPEAYLTEESP